MLYLKKVFFCVPGLGGAWADRQILLLFLPIGVQKPGPSYSPAIYTMDIAYNIDIPLYIFDRYITGI